LSERVVAIQRIIHRAQRVLPAPHAAERHRQPLEQLRAAELPIVLDQRQRLLEVVDRVVERCGVERSLARDRQVVNQTCLVSGTSGMRQVVGELSGVRIEIVGVEARCCCSRPQVQPLALDRRDAGEQRLTDQLVAEHQLASSFAGPDEPGPLRFVEGIDQLVRASLSHLADQIGYKHPAPDCCRDQHLPG
jgi:hypothetical protein